MIKKVSNFKHYRKNSLQGTFEVELLNGLTIKNCCLHERNRKQWIQWPALDYLDLNGQKKYAHILIFKDKKQAEQFKKETILALGKLLNKQKVNKSG